MPERPRVFLLSPARLDGARGKLLFQPATPFPIASQLRTRDGCPIGEVFRFVSGLYFRGKLAYANAFARPPADAGWMGNGALVITLCSVPYFTLLARSVCGFVALFWGTRLAVQFFYFDPTAYLTTLQLKLGYHALTVVFACLTIVYTWSALATRA
jgi:hypothetical protein